MSDTMSGKHLKADGTAGPAEPAEPGVGAQVSGEAQESARLEQPGPDDDTSGAPTPTTATPVNEAASQPERVVCPECGAVAMVSLNRRQSADFCARCDYPLFWTPTEIVRGEGDLDDMALRRLPGTVGRVSVASAACPHCAEANQISAEVCVRCGGPMTVEPTVAAPVVAPPPAPEEPAVLAPMPAWMWATIGLVLALLVWLILYLIGR
ncbi:hypothetical protein [Nocardioides sp.]|uniref:hypothetical protein n=1 Tax=Nocardioides sp. TaxID=35761 RepID=UPI00356470D8